MARREERLFYLFISPWLIGFVLLSGGPIVASAVMSLTDWPLLSGPKWIGLANYGQLATDAVFYQSLRTTFVFAAGSVVFGVAVAFLLALLLNQRVRGIAFFRTVFYLPSVVSGIATAMLWVVVFHPDYGLINYLLAQVGIQGPGWLWSDTWVIPSLVIMTVWGAGSVMVIYLAGLQGIPQQLYEAAAIDGAGWWGKFRHVTVPMMSPVIFFNVITGFIGSLQTYVLILAMTNGGPGNSSLVLGLYIYWNALKYFAMGYASALAWVLFVIIGLITLAQFLLARRWVHYEAA